VSPVTIYNHFGSKEKLVRETVKYLSIRLLGKYRAIIRGEKPFLEKTMKLKDSK
jgi:AcrR family transcriptional regulator